MVEIKSEDMHNLVDEKAGLQNEKRKFKQFLFFFAGQNVSLLGSSIVSFAIIWWITVYTQSELMLGLASLVSLGPYVLVAPFSGVLADKLNKKMLLVVVDAFQAVATITLSILFLTNNVSVAVIFVILAVRGIAQAFHTPISMSITPSMVPQKHLSRINGISYLTSGLVNIIGPVLGAGLLAIPGITLGMILWADVITFVIALIPLLIVTIPSLSKEERKKQLREPVLLQITDGIRTLRNIEGMMALLLGAVLLNFFMSPLMGLLSLFVNKIHSGTEANYALVSGLIQAAIVIGGLLMSVFKGFKKPILILIWSSIFQAICQVAITFIPTDLNGRFLIIGGILFLYALPFAFIDVSFITSLQLMVPKEKIGRVMATVMAITPAMRPLGQFLSGLIAEFVGINIVFIVSGILATLSLIILYLLTPLRKLDLKIGALVREVSNDQAIEDEQTELDIMDEVFGSEDEAKESDIKFYPTASDKAID